MSPASSPLLTAPLLHLSQLLTPPPWKHLITWHLTHSCLDSSPGLISHFSSRTEPRRAHLVSSRPFLCPPAQPRSELCRQRLWHSYRTKCQFCPLSASGHLLFQVSQAAQTFVKQNLCFFAQTCPGRSVTPVLSTSCLGLSLRRQPPVLSVPQTPNPIHQHILSACLWACPQWPLAPVPRCWPSLLGMASHWLQRLSPATRQAPAASPVRTTVLAGTGAPVPTRPGHASVSQRPMSPLCLEKCSSLLGLFLSQNPVWAGQTCSSLFSGFASTMLT